MKVFPKSWEVCAADTVCSEIVDCLNKTAPIVEHDTGYRMIRTTNVRHGRVDVSDNRFVEETVFNKWTRRARPKRGDIILSREAPLGEVGMLRSDARVFLGQRTMLYRADPKKLDQHYLYYQMVGPYVQAVIHGQGQGSTVAHLRVPDAETLPIPVAPRPAQRNIAAILTAYDDLIDANHRRIALLERMAEEIYREWFVRLRFPGHKTGKIVKGLPKGWRVQKLGELFRTASGGTPSRANEANFGGKICWAKTGELKTTFVIDTEEKITPQGLDSSSAKIFPRHTVVIAMYCAMPDISILGVESATNQACCAFFPKHDYLHFTYSYLLIKFAQKHLIMFAHGAAQQNLSQDLIKGFPLLNPTKELVTAFSDCANPLFEQIESLMTANVNLTRTRDALLPRLISGKLRVDDLAIQFPPSMAADAAK